jgi:hypothetical protein
MRQFRLRSIMAVIAFFALAFWAGTQLERARLRFQSNAPVMHTVRSMSDDTRKTSTVPRPIEQVGRGRRGLNDDLR